jgi:hypothetical protein
MSERLFALYPPTRTLAGCWIGLLFPGFVTCTQKIAFPEDDNYVNQECCHLTVLPCWDWSNVRSRVGSGVFEEEGWGISYTLKRRDNFLSNWCSLTCLQCQVRVCRPMDVSPSGYWLNPFCWWLPIFCQERNKTLTGSGYNIRDTDMCNGDTITILTDGYTPKGWAPGTYVDSSQESYEMHVCQCFSVEYATVRFKCCCC